MLLEKQIQAQENLFIERKFLIGCVLHGRESDFMMQSGSRRLVETGIRLRQARMVVLICRWIRQLLYMIC